MLGELDALAVGDDRRPHEGRPRSRDEVGIPGEPDRRACAAVHDADRVQRAVSGMDAREREPVVPRDLPGNSGQRKRGG